jgi:hypothetical protein
LRRGVKVEEIDDVQIASVSNDDILRYVAANNRWENTAITTSTITEGTNLYYTQARVNDDIDGRVTKSFVDALNVNAATANQLTTARDIQLSGNVTGTASFDGSANINITTTVVDNSHNHTIANVTGLQSALDNKVSLTSSTGSAIIPVGTESERDSSPIAGLFRFNSDTSKFEGYDGTEWGEIAGSGVGGSTISSDTVIDITTTTTGTTFDLGEPISDALVSLNGAWVSPNNFSFSGNNIIFDFSLEIDDEILVYPIIENIDGVQVIDNLVSTDTNKALSANQGRVLSEALDDKVDLTTNQTIAGEKTFTDNVAINGDLDIGSVLSTETTTLSTTTESPIATFSSTTFGSAKILVQATRGSDRHITELLIVHDGSTASATEYGTITTNGLLFNLDVDINSNNVRVLATGSTADSTTYKVYKTLIKA